MTLDNLRQELDELTKIPNPAERLIGVIRFMSLCSGLQAAGILSVASQGGSDAEQLVTEMNDIANACVPIAVHALDEVVRGDYARRA
jgi:hypothetical protein